MNNRRFSLILAAVVSASSLLGLAACQTYVNIPAQTGDVASADANGSNVRNLIGESLRGLRPEALAPGKYQVLLPAGSTRDTYQDVMKIAGDHFTWADSPGSGNVVDQLEIRAIRIRALNASVDIIRSTQPGNADAPRQLVTVYLKRYLVGGWGTQRVRVWRMSVQDALVISAGEPLEDLDNNQNYQNNDQDYQYNDTTAPKVIQENNEPIQIQETAPSHFTN